MISSIDYLFLSIKHQVTQKTYITKMKRFVARLFSKGSTTPSTLPFMDSHEAIQAAAGPNVLRDIEGIDPKEHGFCRDECAEIPAKLKGSFKPLLTHIFVPTALPTTEWHETCKNIPSYVELSAEAKKSLPQCTVTVFHEPGSVHTDSRAAESCVVMRRDGVASQVSIHELPAAAALQSMASWKEPSTAVEGGRDVSQNVFVFVCSHRLRDARCGYCGPVLVEMINKKLTEAVGEFRNIRAFACSHVGGHVYAGNVIVYTRHGGICFGCFCPSDVDTLVEALLAQDVPFPSAGTVPEKLQNKVRGEISLKP